MSELDTTPTAENAVSAEAQADADHGADADHAGHEGHGGPSLGPIDWPAYGAGLVGAVLGLVVAGVLAVTTGYVTL
jgi:hypothetical protein